MKTLTLRNRLQENATLIGNEFIDKYMAGANGEFVKVYLFLMRHLHNPGISLTISTIADCLENTETDILRALKYWAKEGLLTIDYDDQGKIIALDIGDLDTSSIKETATVTSVSSNKDTHITKKVTPRRRTSKSREELKQLLFIAEQYLERTLSKKDMDMVSYFFDTLHFSSDLVEYLLEYAIDSGHKSMYYMEKIAITWADLNITTVEQAKKHSIIYNKDGYAVLNAFGIKGRSLVPGELAFLEKWTNEYGFTIDIITAACARTMAGILKPSFEYTDTILKNWQTKGVHHLEDIKLLDLTYEKEKSGKKKSTPKVSANNKFNNFSQRTYDMAELEKKLLNHK